MPQTSGGDSPPPYEDALQLPPFDGNVVAEPPLSASSSFRLRRQSSSYYEEKRRLSIQECADENEDGDAETNVVVATDDNDADESYSMEDEAFEPYDDDQPSHTAAIDAQQEDEGADNTSDDPEVISSRELFASSVEIQTSLQCLEPTRRPTSRSSPKRQPSRGHAAASSSPSTATAPLVYDEQTYSIVSKLRALNRQLSTKVEQQAKQIQSLQDEKKLHIAKIQTLERDVNMLKQTIRNIQNTGASADRVVSVRSPEKRTSSHKSSDEGRPPSYSSLVPSSQQSEAAARLELPHVLAIPQPPPRSPHVPAGESSRPRTSPRKVDSSPRSPSPSSSSSSPVRRPIHTAPAASSSPSPGDKLLAAKVAKLEQEKQELQHRHAHQLANYSHELSRLERQIESAQKLVQAKDYELRLQKSRHLYASCSSSGASGTSPRSMAVGAGKDGTNRHHHYATMLSDALWRELMPSTPPASTMLALPFTSNVGLAFEQLLGHQLLSFHDHMVDATTRDWLHEIRRCGFQVLSLHHDFQCMALTFKKLAECTHIYDLAETFTKEVKQLTKAEQAFLFVMDPAENEFWCRVPRNQDEINSKDMITVRSRVMPISGVGGVSAVAAEHTGTTAQHTAMLAAATTATHVPCGLASWVFHSKKPLLIPAGHATKNPYFSTAPDSTDRLMHFKSASTLLLPIIHGSTTIGVIQVCGKLTQVAALGVSISLEKCEAFTLEDQAYLTMLGHFLSGILPKAAYFTEVESNKVNEETLIQLAPEIFTCLRFEELGKIVIQNAKEILDADRCSLFVADNDDRMLFNWQSDISGKGGVEVVNDVKKSTMRIPFGHGIVGMVAETKDLINIPDAYEDSRFNSSWDKKTNYRTKSILTVPILTTPSAKTKAPIRRRPSQHDVYGSVIVDENPLKQGKGHGQTSHQHVEPQQTLLGVVQVINKSGGAPFRSKDEFLLQTISKLIALAIENSQLFQKTQELCASLGKLIADADLVEAVATLGSCAEDIIGVESAAIYILAPEQGVPGLVQPELFTFHRKRRHKIVVKEQMYRHSLLDKVLRTRELVIVNDISPSTPNFNAYVDSIAGITARNVLFMPLLVDDPEDATQNAKKLIGVLHLVNTRGRKVKFERFDLFLSIVSSQTCSVLASILEKQAIMRQQEQTKHLLDTTLSFFKEMSPVGIINAVYNTCSSLFGVEKAHLFLWEADHRTMWTAKLSPNAESVSAAMTTTAMNDPSIGSGGSNVQSSGLSSRAPSLRTQSRRISVLTDQTITIPTNEGLLEHVLGKSSLVVVKHWVDSIEEANENEHEGEADSEVTPNATRRTSRKMTITPGSAMSLNALELSKYVLRASRSDYRAGFTKHAVVACPVWDIYGLEIVGVVVLFFPKGRAPPPSELTNLPLLSRQISGALNVCDDLRAVTQRSRKLQDIVEMYQPRRATPTPAMSFTLSSRGQLVTFSQPLNVTTLSFSVSSLLQFSSSVASTANHHTLELHKLPIDEDGHRWVFVVSGAGLQEMTTEHFVNWIGKDVSSGAAAGAFDKLRTDLQSVYVRKESVRGVVTLPVSQQPKAHSAIATGAYPTLPLTSLPRAVQLQLRLMLWEYMDAQQWKIDIKHACKIFDHVDPTRSRHISRHHLEYALTTNGRSVELDQLEWDLLHAQFADPETDLIHVERMFQALAPQFKVVSSFQYELTPVLDSVTQSVVNVHVLLTANKPAAVSAPSESYYV